MKKEEHFIATMPYDNAGYLLQNALLPQFLYLRTLSGLCLMKGNYRLVYHSMGLID
jgi:hypothetical protein